MNTQRLSDKSDVSVCQRRAKRAHPNPIVKRSLVLIQDRTRGYPRANRICAEYMNHSISNTDDGGMDMTTMAQRALTWIGRSNGTSESLSNAATTPGILGVSETHERG